METTEAVGLKKYALPNPTPSHHVFLLTATILALTLFLWSLYAGFYEKEYTKAIYILLLGLSVSKYHKYCVDEYRTDRNDFLCWKEKNPGTPKSLWIPGDIKKL